MKIDIQINTDNSFAIESPVVPRIGDTLRVRVPNKPAGQDVIHVKVYNVHWNLLTLPDISAYVYAETASPSNQ